MVKLIHTEAPQRPACFESQGEWVQWLVSAHEAGLKVVRRQDVGKHAGNRTTAFKVLPVGQQSHCAECSQRRRDAMKAAGRCFPVAPPQVQRPAPAPADTARRAQFEAAGVATLKNVAVRKRGPEEARYLALVLDVEMVGIDPGVCAFFDPMLVPFLYRQELGGRVVRNEALRPIAYGVQLQGATVEINRSTFNNADVSNFVVCPIDGTRVTLRCRVVIYPGKANFSDLIGAVREGVRLRIVGPADLFDEHEEEAKPQAQAALL